MEMLFLFSLPITRKDYVLEKYIFGLISGIMFLLLGTVISLVVIGITKTGSFNEIFLTAGSLFPTILLILSIMLPFILKFGGEKGRIAIIGVMGFIFVIGLLLIKTTEYLGIDLYVLINKLPKFEPLVYIILFLLLSVVILGISYLISLTILKKKEF
ncbi:MAG: ABC-2 transporter permease [Blautia massiliensis (ex Durand et al. 2017)]|uniref:ABC-2 transporter permease n=1 Tax=Blautia massiliensis (ex Durand et al. 2017) TaxID=1737424 RepID=UPI00399C87E3